MGSRRSAKSTRGTSLGVSRKALTGLTFLALSGVVGNEWALPSAVASPWESYPRKLALELTASPTAQVGWPLLEISVRLHNPGDEAPNARLRIIIHDKYRRQDPGRRELNPDNVKVEVFESGLWKPVLLEAMDGSVMGAIGRESASEHRERHKRGGFAIPARFDRRWPLRVTFSFPGTYTFLVAASPDNGSTHLAEPAHTTIEVR